MNNKLTGPTLIITFCAILATSGSLHAQNETLTESQLGEDILQERFESRNSLSADGNRVALLTSWLCGVYQWNGSGWIQLGNDIIGEIGGDHYANSVSLSADGSRVAIGRGRWGPTHVWANGRVAIYQWDGGDWVQLGINIDGQKFADQFGSSVSLSSDGNALAIGASGNGANGYDAGRAVIYRWSGNSWVQIGNDIEGEAPGDSGGSFTTSGNWVSLSADGSRVAIGARGNDGNGIDSGHVRIWQWDGDAWVQIGNDINGKVPNDRIGAWVYLSADGNRVAIGSDGELIRDGDVTIETGDVRIYQWDGSGWIQLGDDLIDDGESIFFGDAVSFSADGSRVALDIRMRSSPSSPRVRIYQWRGGGWALVTDDIAAAGCSNRHFSLSALGNRLAIGCGNSSSVYEFIPVPASPSLILDSFYEADTGESITVDATPTAGYPAEYTYQWYLDDFPIQANFGGTAPSYGIGGVTGNEGAWRVEVTNDTGTTAATFDFRVYVDSDGDALSDGREEFVIGSDPEKSDSDGDGLNDYEEWVTHGTSPTSVDSDGDGFNDKYELDNGYDPTSSDSIPDTPASLETAFELSFVATLGANYTIEFSEDTENWVEVEGNIVGQGGEVRRFFSIRDYPKGFFRVERMDN